MGMSTDADLVFGVDFGEDTSNFPWFGKIMMVI